MVQQGMTTSLSDYDTRTRRRAACEKFWKPYQPTNRCTSVGLHFTGLTLDQVGRNSSFAVSLSQVMIVTFTMMNINITSGVTVIIALYHYCCYFWQITIFSTFFSLSLNLNLKPCLPVGNRVFKAKQMWKRKTNKWQGHINFWANTTSRKPQSLPKNSSTRQCYEQRFLNIVNFCTWKRFPLAMAKCTGLPATTTTIKKQM